MGGAFFVYILGLFSLVSLKIFVYHRLMQERVGYKVVTSDLESLGLRKNPNIMKFSPGEWVRLDRSQTQEGKGDWGGIWVAKTKGGAKVLVKYMKEKHQVDCRVFMTTLGIVLFENSYRIKTDAVLLGEEITSSIISE